jgi:2-polyprenyl-3-methyl-5-hydroxy-6-metoxy-1,4-benzoquinol methylase
MERASQVETDRAIPYCKLCGGSTKPLMTHNGFQIFRCTSCEFMFALLPRNYDLRAVYVDDAYWNGGLPYGYPDYEQAWRDARRLVLTRLDHLDRLMAPGRMLEIGCAAGHFLREARSRSWQICGVELSPTMRERCARQLGCQVFSSLQELAASELRFDCVAMFEVIEHLEDPLPFMRQVRDLMKPRAILMLSTPNFNAPEAWRNPHSHHWFCPPAHVSYFKAATLHACVARAGFEAIQIRGVLEGDEMPLPRILIAALAPFRRGRRLRPGGLIGKLIKSWQRRRRDLLNWANSMELYARNAAHPRLRGSSSA